MHSEVLLRILQEKGLWVIPLGCLHLNGFCSLIEFAFHVVTDGRIVYG